MIIDEFLIALGLRVDTNSINQAERLESAVDGVADAASNADAQTATLGQRIGRSFAAGLTIVGAAATAIQTALTGAVAYFNGYISRAEEYYNSKEDDVRITAEQLEMANRYNEGLDRLGKVIESIRVRVAFSFLPAMLRAVDTFNKLLDSNRELIQNGISRLLNVLALASQAIINTIRFIDMVITRTTGWTNALYIIAAALLYVRRASILAFVTNPIALVVAALVGLIVLIDDFITYLDGGESEFGEFWGTMLEYIEVITPALQKLWDLLIQGASYAIEAGVYFTQYFGGALVDTIEALTAIWTIFVALLTGDFDLLSVSWDGLIENLLSAFTNFAQLFEPLAQLLVRIFVAVFDRIRTYVVGVFNSMVQTVSSFISRIAAVLANVFNIVTAPFRLAFDFIVNTFNRLPSLIGNIISKLPRVNAISSIGSAVTSGVNRIVNNIGGQTSATINVTAPNAISAANQTANALSNVQAQRNLGGQAIA